MKFNWENDGKPNAEGFYVAVIDTEDGRGVQRFEGKEHKEVADKLLAAQASATVKIGELDQQVKRGRKPVAASRPSSAARAELNPEEKAQIGSELQNPATAADAVAKVVEKVKADEKSAIQQADEDRQKAYEAAVEFRSEQPAYIVCDHNSKAMGQYLKLYNLDPRVKDNYHVAYDSLSESGLLVVDQPAPAPAAEPAAPAREPERIAPPPTRPRGHVASSGLRSEHSSGTPPAPQKKPPYTRLEIDTMPGAEYEKRYREDPEFRRIVDQLYSAPSR